MGSEERRHGLAFLGALPHGLAPWKVLSLPHKRSWVTALVPGTSFSSDGVPRPRSLFEKEINGCSRKNQTAHSRSQPPTTSLFLKDSELGNPKEVSGTLLFPDAWVNHSLPGRQESRRRGKKIEFRAGLA